VNQILTRGIILKRTNFGEADRIITVLTPSQGKLRLMAKGVRRAKSKLAGGIELFSTSDLTFIRGKGEIGTLISSRLRDHYGRIILDLNRVQLGYACIQMLDKATEDEPEAAYYGLLETCFKALDDQGIDTRLIELWFKAQLLTQAGHMPNLSTDTAGEKLRAEATYNFDLEAMTFTPHSEGNFNAQHIKALRLLFARHQPKQLAQVEGIDKVLPSLQMIVATMHQAHIRT
jgi:DNA repair protein RecO